MHLAPEQTVFGQGDAAEALYYIARGWIKISVVAANGKEAVIALTGGSEFFGTRCLIKDHVRMASATTLTECTLVRISRAAAIRLLREDPDFAEIFATCLARQALRRDKGLVAYLTHSSERRLAQALLELLGNCHGDELQPISTPITQAVLANMIGTTRSRVSVFMNRFRRQGLIEYDRHGHVTASISRLRKFLGG